MNLIVVGPCGVGKSTVAMAMAKQANMAYLDFDAIGLVDMKTRKGQPSPFSSGKLNFMQSLPIMIQNEASNFILDIGGGTVFLKDTDNNERLVQVLWLKKTYNAHIIVITAAKNILISRFVSTKERNENEFYEYEIWENWINIAEPHWRKCADVFIESSFLTIGETIRQIEENIRMAR